MPKYVTRQELDLWGNDVTVTRREMTANDVAGAVGTGLGMMISAGIQMRIAALEARMKTAAEYYQNGDYFKAIEFANTLITSNNAGYKQAGYMIIGMSCYNLKRYDEAIAAITSFLDLASVVNNPSEELRLGYSYRGECYLVKKDLALALKDFAQCIRLDPRGHEGYFDQGRALLELGNLNLALENFTQAIALDPGNDNYYSWRANVYRDMKQYDKAIDDINIALRLAPRNTNHYDSRCAFYRALGNYNQALDDLTQAITLSPQDSYFYMVRCNIYREMGNVNSALDAISQAISINRDIVRYFKIRSEIYQTLGEHVKAQKDIDRARYLEYHASLPDKQVAPQVDPAVPQSILTAAYKEYLKTAVEMYNRKRFDKAYDSSSQDGEQGSGGLSSRQPTNAAIEREKKSRYLAQIAEYELTKPGFGQFYPLFLQVRAYDHFTFRGLEEYSAALFKQGGAAYPFILMLMEQGRISHK